MGEIDAVSAFIDEARKVSFLTIAERFKRSRDDRRDEWTGPCPQCGGEDRYAVNRKKSAFLCRNCGAAGRDGIALAAHELGLDLNRRAEFLEACSAVLGGRPVPAEGERETPEERQAREARIAAAREKADADNEKAAARGEAERQKAIRKARGLYFKAVPDIGWVADYLKARTGFAMPAGVFENLLCDSHHGYWSDAHRDDRGFATEVHRGPAMIAPFVNLDGEVVGCHETWIDLDAGPKCRVRLWVRTDAGKAAGAPWIEPTAVPPAEAVEAGHYELMKAKKMQGSKMGALIPVCGDMAATRWVVAEGIESVAGFAALDGFRDDTFYCAAGDMGNIAGKADRSSDFNHPVLKDRDKRGRWRARRIAGPVPAEGDDRALKLPGHVRTLLIAVDGDSEFIWTAAAISRSCARLAREGLEIVPCWPPAGMDWAEVSLAVAMAKKEAA